jgi:polyhydroxyalkanoate synthesis regulator phasin
METTLKNLLYAGVGIASTATEKLEKEINNLVEKGKTSDSEAKKVVDEFISKTEKTYGEFETKFNEIVEKFGYAKTSEVTELKKRLEELEGKTKTTTTTKTTSKA